jgi:hypothetical protein
MVRSDATAWRTGDAQKRLLLRRTDTIPLPYAAKKVANVCDHWQEEKPAPFDVPGLLRLALLNGRDTHARSLGEQWVAQLSTRDTIARAERLAQLVDIYLSARPRTPERIATAWHFRTLLRQMSPTVYH